MIPVYFINGFLESGKTSFLNYTLSRQYFMDGEKTLLIVCEEGIEEFDEKDLSGKNVHLEYLEHEDDFNSAKLNELGKKHNPERVIIEYNGMWKQDSFRKMTLPSGWETEQMITMIDASSFETYLNNLRPMVMAMTADSEMIVFNRCTDDMPLERYKRILKAANRKADFVFEGDDGEKEMICDEDLPYDVTGDIIDVKEEDYMIFYLDMQERRDRYEGKRVKFTGCILKASDFPADLFAVGRPVMMCCMEDIQFAGYACRYDKAADYETEQWVRLKAAVKYEEFEMYGGTGPILYIESLEKVKTPKNKILNVN